MYRSVTLRLFLVVALASLAAPAGAQNIDAAISAYRAGNFTDAASQFYAVLRFEDEPGLIVEAQYGLAKSFEELELYIAAFTYYEAIVREGSEHPYFDKAVEGLIRIADKLDDDFKIPRVLDSIYERNYSALEKLNPEVVQRLNFVIGRHSYLQQNIGDARKFLKTIKPQNPDYPRAQYLLGLIALGVDRPDSPEPDYETALAHFENARGAIDPKTEEPRLQKLYDLATLAIARAFYERAYRLDEANPKEAPLRDRFIRRSIYEYRRIPRFSAAWADALFERAWAFTVATNLENNYGKALGSLHSLRAPYFRDEFYPESDILEAIIYYYNCQWDRVNDVLDAAKAKYTPMVKQIQALLETDLEFDEWYALLGRSLEAGPDAKDKNLIPWPVAKKIQKDPRFVKFESFLQELEREAKEFQTNSAFNRSEMGREMTDFALETRDAFVQLLGRYVKTRLNKLGSELSSITTRASIVSLETKTAETEWLEQGRKIAGVVRSRLPRPFIPDDTFQFWWFRNEYWIDELGYYEYTIKTECIFQ